MKETVSGCFFLNIAQKSPGTLKDNGRERGDSRVTDEKSAQRDRLPSVCNIMSVSSC